MSIETEIVTRLEDDAGVGTNAANRIYPAKLPQSPTYPAVVYSKISSPREHNLSGTTGWARTRIQIDSLAETYGASKSLADAIRASMDGFTGVLTTLTATIKLENEQDVYDDEARAFRVIQDYRILHEE